MFIPDPDFVSSRISDSGSRIQQNNKEEAKKFFFCHFCSHKFGKIYNYFEKVQKDCIFNTTKLFGISGSEIRKLILDPDPQHYKKDKHTSWVRSNEFIASYTCVQKT